MPALSQPEVEVNVEAGALSGTSNNKEGTVSNVLIMLSLVSMAAMGQLLKKESEKDPYGVQEGAGLITTADVTAPFEKALNGIFKSNVK